MDLDALIAAVPAAAQAARAPQSIDDVIHAVPPAVPPAGTPGTSLHLDNETAPPPNVAAPPQQAPVENQEELYQRYRAGLGPSDAWLQAYAANDQATERPGWQVPMPSHATPPAAPPPAYALDQTPNVSPGQVPAPAAPIPYYTSTMGGGDDDQTMNLRVASLAAAAQHAQVTSDLQQYGGHLGYAAHEAKNAGAQVAGELGKTGSFIEHAGSYVSPNSMAMYGSPTSASQLPPTPQEDEAQQALRQKAESDRQSAQQFVDEHPVHTTLGKAAVAVGSAAPQLAATVAAPIAAPLVWGVTGAANAYNRAKQAGADDATANLESMWGGGIGVLTSFLPGLGKANPSFLRGLLQNAAAMGVQSTADDVVARRGHGDPKTWGEILTDALTSMGVGALFHTVFHGPEALRTLPDKELARQLGLNPNDPALVSVLGKMRATHAAVTSGEANPTEAIQALDGSMTPQEQAAMAQVVKAWSAPAVAEAQPEQPLREWNPAATNRQISNSGVRDAVQTPVEPAAPQRAAVEPVRPPAGNEPGRPGRQPAAPAVSVAAERPAAAAEPLPRPGPAGDASPAANPQPGPARPQGQDARPPEVPGAAVTAFTTSQGSTYSWDGTSTQRTKSPHAGHEAGDVGLKPPSDRTIFVDPEVATEIGMHMGLNSESRPSVEVSGDQVILRKQYGQGWAKTHTQSFPIESQPAVGLSPVELWRNGTVHAGNPITEMNAGPKADSPAAQAPTKPPQADSGSQQAPPANTGVPPVPSPLDQRSPQAEGGRNGQTIRGSIQDASRRGWDYKIWARNFPRSANLLGSAGPELYQQAFNNPSTPPVDNPSPAPKASPRPFSKPDLQQRILDVYRDQGGGIPGDVHQFAESLPDAFTFKRGGQYSGEVARLAGRKEAGKVGAAIMRNKAVTFTDDASRAGGEDAINAFRDRYGPKGEDYYWQLVRERSGVKPTLDDALEFARNSTDPQHQLLAAHFDAYQQGGAPKADIVAGPDLATGAEFKTLGHPARVVENADGERMLEDGGDIPPLPVDQLHAVPVDKGTLRHVEPDLPAGEVFPAEQQPTFYNADDAGTSKPKGGLFGQTVFDAATGNQQGSFFDATKPQSVSEPIAGSRNALDPRNTGQLFGGGGKNQLASGQPDDTVGGNVSASRSSTPSPSGPLQPRAGEAGRGAVPVPDAAGSGGGRPNAPSVTDAGGGGHDEGEVVPHARKVELFRRHNLELVRYGDGYVAIPKAGGPPIDVHLGQESLWHLFDLQFGRAQIADAALQEPALHNRMAEILGGEPPADSSSLSEDDVDRILAAVRPRGAYDPGDDSIWLTREAAEDTVEHEIGHAATARLPDAMRAALRQEYGGPGVSWVRFYERVMHDPLPADPAQDNLAQQAARLVRTGHVFDQFKGPPSPDLDAGTQTSMGPADEGRPRAMAASGGGGRSSFRPSPPPTSRPPATPAHLKSDLYGPGSFVADEVAPKALGAVRTLTEFVDQVRKAVAPQTRGETARRVSLALREMMARRALADDRAFESLRKASALFDGMSKDASIEFWDRAERGDDQGDPALNVIAKALVDFERKQGDEVRRVAPGKLRQLITDKNYLGRIWKDPDKAAGVLSRIFGKRPLEGPKGFMKQRSIDWFVDGINAGLEPVTYNPVDMALLKGAEMRRYIELHRTLNELKADGLRKYVGVNDEPPEGWETVEDAAFKVYGPPTITIDEAYDKGVREPLLDLARSLGIRHERLVSLKGGAWGLSHGGSNKVQTKFGGSDSVLAHEIGHQIGDRWNLLRRMTRDDDPAIKTKKGQQRMRAKLAVQLRALADLRHEFSPAVSGHFKQYVREGSEKEAAIVQAWVSARDKFRAVAPDLYQRWVRFLNDTPALRPLLNIEPSMDLGSDTAEKPHGGLLLMGRYYVPGEAAQLFRNILTPGLRQRSGIVRVWFGVNNVLNGLQLGLSGFHATVTSIHSVVNELSNALTRASAGDFKGAGKALLTAPVAPAVYAYRGHQVMREWHDPGSGGGVTTKVVQSLVAGGGRAKMDSAFQLRGIANLRKAIRQVRAEAGAAKVNPIAKALVRMPGAAVDASMAPVLKLYVPRIKLGAFYSEIQHEWGKLGPNPTKEQMRDAAAKLWDRIDARFGEMTYDNTFWHPALRDLFHMVIRAVGWAFGNVNEAAHAIGDPFVETFRAFREQRLPQLPRATAFAGALFVVAGLIGGLIHYLHTGERPKSLKDLFFPVTGHGGDGKPIRTSVPSYTKDVFETAHDPTGTLKNKIAPALSLAIALMQNKDYRGVEIHEPGHFFSEDTAKYLGQQLTPMSVEQWEKMGEQGITPARRLGAFAGFSNAPRWLDQTSAEQALQKLKERFHLSGAATKQEAQHGQAVRDVVNKLRQLAPQTGYAATTQEAASRAAATTQVVGDAHKQGLSQRDIDRARDESRRSALADGLMDSRITAAQAMQVYQVANDVEKRQLYPVVLYKIGLLNIPQKGKLAMKAALDKMAGPTTQPSTRPAALAG